MSLLTNLEAFFDLDGNLTDATGHGHNGTPAANLGYVAGLIGSAASNNLATAAGFFAAVAVNSTSVWSVSFNIKPNAQFTFGPYGLLLGRASNDALYIYQASAGSQTYLQLWVGGSTLASVPLNNGVSNLCVLTFDGTSARIYVGGALVATVASTANWPAMTGNVLSLSTTNYAVRGALDLLGIWVGRTLSAGDVTQLYNGGAGRSFVGLAPAAPTVTSISPASGLLTGGTAVTITGTGFVTGATVTIGGVAATSVVFVGSTSLTAVVPAHAPGAGDVVVTNPDTQTGTLVGGFTFAPVPPVFTKYGSMLAKLLPPGVLWDLEPTSPLRKLLMGMGDEFQRVENRSGDLFEESDPRTATETITDWERVMSLPDDFVTVIPGTLAARRVAVTQKLTSRVGQNLAFYAQLCAACGYPLLSITKYAGAGLLRCDDRCDERCYDTHWANAFTITVSPATTGALTHAQFEAVVRNATHAHVQTVFVYT